MTVKVTQAVSSFSILSSATLRQALAVITENQSGVIFVVEGNGVLQGVLTDGDLRNWLIGADTSNLDDSVMVACNRNCLTLPISTSPLEIQASLSHRIKQIPLVDEMRRLVGVALDQPFRVEIDSFVISDDRPTFIIAEIGNNHNGSIDKACLLIDEAVKAGADCAKFQMRDLPSLYGEGSLLRRPSDLGVEYTVELLKKYQLDVEELYKAFDHCKHRGIIPLCTPWDKKSLENLESYGLSAYKIASPDLTNYEFIEEVAQCRKPIICSTGMSKEFEIKGCVNKLTANNSEFILLLCNSTYPTPFKDVHLDYLDRLKEITEGRPVGYSGHERGFFIPLAAVARGARVVEKHFTLNKEAEGNDHRVSLTPGEFADMVRGIREIEASFGDPNPRTVTQGEMINRQTLGKSVYAVRQIIPGEILKDKDLVVRSPGYGIPPYRKRELFGKRAPRKIEAGGVFFDTDVNPSTFKRKHYLFKHRYGIPVRFHDFKNLTAETNLDLVEFHLSYKDLEQDVSQLFGTDEYDLDVIVHSPELFQGDLLLDLCAWDQASREKSIKEFMKVVEITKRISRCFRGEDRPKIVTNVGGFSFDNFFSEQQKEDAYGILKKTLDQLEHGEVEILPQTMPPFPWHFGGQRFHNLFTDSASIRHFCETTKTRICLDISHSKLFCSHQKISFKRFLEEVEKFVSHMHLVDAQGVDDEGLQIGEGEVDFALVADIFEHTGKDLSFIPEIWQGHHNDGHGFWTALERLEPYFGPTSRGFREVNTLQEKI